VCVLSYRLTRWIGLVGRSKGSKLAAEGVWERLRRVNLDELGIPGISARCRAVKGLNAEDRSGARAFARLRSVFGTWKPRGENRSPNLSRGAQLTLASVEAEHVQAVNLTQGPT
jgi:hypothetical protein